MTSIGSVHLVFSLLAIVFGAVTLLLPKGTRWHRTWGHGYVWCMLGLIVTALVTYDLTGGVTPFHLAAVVALVTVGAGLWVALARRPAGGWVEAHATWMAWSYVGLMAAFVAESLTRFVMPRMAGTLEEASLWGAFWALVAVGSLGAGAGGAWLIRRKLPAAVKGVRRVGSET